MKGILEIPTFQLVKAISVFSSMIANRKAQTSQYLFVFQGRLAPRECRYLHFELMNEFFLSQKNHIPDFEQ